MGVRHTSVQKVVATDYGSQEAWGMWEVTMSYLEKNQGTAPGMNHVWGIQKKVVMLLVAQQKQMGFRTLRVAEQQMESSEVVSLVSLP